MNPTCREPDLLEIIPYGDRPVKRGDIICFRPPGSSHSVVHRVIRITSGGIRTRGDNNTENDPYLAHPSDINGKVVSAWRGRNSRRIAGGWRGSFIQYGVRLRRFIRKMIAKVLERLYYRLARDRHFPSPDAARAQTPRGCISDKTPNILQIDDGTARCGTVQQTPGNVAYSLPLSPLCRRIHTAKIMSPQRRCRKKNRRIATMVKIDGGFGSPAIFKLNKYKKMNKKKSEG